MAQKEKKAPEKAEGAAGTKDKRAAAKEQEEISRKAFCLCGPDRVQQEFPDKEE